jgi:C4-dicarboxylate transporter DctM subunit
MPAGFALLGIKLGWRYFALSWTQAACAIVLPLAGWALGARLDEVALPLWPGLLRLLAILLAGVPIFVVLGDLALVLFWQDGLPLVSMPLSHYAVRRQATTRLARRTGGGNCSVAINR